MIRLVAREGDLVLCTKHAVGKIEPPDRQVKVNNRNIAAVGDEVSCLAVVNPNIVLPQYDVGNKVMAGAADVLVAGHPVSGLLHCAQHNSGPPQTLEDGPPCDGFVLLGSFDVLIGGATAVGNTAAALAACAAAAASRSKSTGKQSYDNCGCEAMREIAIAANPMGGVPGEDEFLNRQAAAGNAQVPLTDAQTKTMMERCKSCDDKVRAAAKKRDESASDTGYPTPAAQKEFDAAQQEVTDCQSRYRAEVAQTKRANRASSGGTNTAERQNMAGTAGVPETTQGGNSPQDVATAVGQGKGVVVPGKSMPVAGGGTADSHIITVAGVVLDENGKVTKVIYNDSAAGCGMEMSGDDFKNHTQDAPTNVTKRPVY